jgi:hypothetical protein
MTLKTAIDDGAFDNIDDRVVRISYIGEGSGATPPPSPPDGGTGSGGDGALPGYVWAILAIGIVLVLLLAYLTMRRKRGQTTREPVDGEEEIAFVAPPPVASSRSAPLGGEPAQVEQDWDEDSWVESLDDVRTLESGEDPELQTQGLDGLNTSDDDVAVFTEENQ